MPSVLQTEGRTERVWEAPVKSSCVSRKANNIAAGDPASKISGLISNSCPLLTGNRLEASREKKKKKQTTARDIAFEAEVAPGTTSDLQRGGAFLLKERQGRTTRKPSGSSVSNAKSDTPQRYSRSLPCRGLRFPSTFSSFPPSTSLLWELLKIQIMPILSFPSTGTHSNSGSTADVDCRGGYGAWSQCEPLEGHDTHHDSEDEFNLQRGPDGYYVGECFQYRTFHVITPARGNGNKCSKKDGSKVFRYCSDCSAVPAVYKHLDAPPVVSSMRFFAVIAGIFCLVATIVFVAICLKKVLAEDTQQTPIPFYSTQRNRQNTPRAAPPSETAKGLCLSVDEMTEVAASR
ncbi:hypothetical protein Efla_004784 [Eimeria flavescens]